MGRHGGSEGLPPGRSTERKRSGLQSGSHASITIGAESVYAYIDDRNEAEFVVNVPRDMRLKKVELLPTEQGTVAELTTIPDR